MTSRKVYIFIKLSPNFYFDFFKTPKKPMTAIEGKDEEITLEELESSISTQCGQPI